LTRRSRRELEKALEELGATGDCEDLRAWVDA
jgi:predicted secreted Zn-dependent protease